jgi:hypothetical protein
MDDTICGARQGCCNDRLRPQAIWGTARLSASDESHCPRSDKNVSADHDRGDAATSAVDDVTLLRLGERQQPCPRRPWVG